MIRRSQQCREEKQEARHALRAQRPAAVQIKIAAEAHERVRKRHARAQQEEEDLQVLLTAKQKEVEDLSDELDGYADEMATLQEQIQGDAPPPLAGPATFVLNLEQWNLFLQLQEMARASGFGQASPAGQPPERQAVWPPSPVTPQPVHQRTPERPASMPPLPQHMPVPQDAQEVNDYQSVTSRKENREEEKPKGKEKEGASLGPFRARILKGTRSDPYAGGDV